MAVKSRRKTYTYRYPDGVSTWTFRSEKIDGDEDTVQGMISETLQEPITPKEFREAKKSGTFEALVLSKISTETKMTAKRAWLTHMSVSASGPEVTVPEGFAKGEELGGPESELEKDPKTGENIPHPLIGEVHPLTAEWIATHDPEELTDIYEILEELWAGRSPEEETTFPGAGERVEQRRAGKRHATA